MLQSTHSAGTLVDGCGCLHTCLKAFSLSNLFDCIASPQYIPALTALQYTIHSPSKPILRRKRCKVLGWLVPLVLEEKDSDEVQVHARFAASILRCSSLQ